MEGNYAKAYETLMQDERRLLQFGSFGKGWSLWTTKTSCDFHFQMQISDPKDSFVQKQKMLTKIIVWN